MSIPMQYSRNCPKCNKTQYYATKEGICVAIKKARICKSCIKMGTKHSCECKRKISKSLEKNTRTLGHHLSISHKIKSSNAGKLRYENKNVRLITSQQIKIAMHRPEIRKKHIEALAETKWLGKSVDKGQIKLLEKWNKLGFNFHPNYQVYTDTDLFYIDGYDKEQNVVLEYDSKYHNRLGQKDKDLIRQNKIINILKPKKFWRYNSVNKQFRNVLERNS